MRGEDEIFLALTRNVVFCAQEFLADRSVTRHTGASMFADRSWRRRSRQEAKKRKS